MFAGFVGVLCGVFGENGVFVDFVRFFYLLVCTALIVLLESRGFDFSGPLYYILVWGRGVLVLAWRRGLGLSMMTDKR